jgi:hypothetical protein
MSVDTNRRVQVTFGDRQSAIVRPLSASELDRLREARRIEAFSKLKTAEGRAQLVAVAAAAGVRSTADAQALIDADPLIEYRPADLVSVALVTSSAAIANDEDIETVARGILRVSKRG